MLHRSRSLAGLFAVLLLAPPAGAQLERIAPGDRLEIAVRGEELLSRVYRVDEAGMIQIEQVGQLPVAGLTVNEARDLIRQRLAEYLREPDVRLELEARAQLLLSAAGEFEEVGPFALPRGSRVRHAYAALGGYSEEANDANLRIHRRGQEEPILIDLRAVLRGDTTQDIELRDGDYLYLPRHEERFFRVTGAVNDPREYPARERVRLLQALVDAGGLLEDADGTRVALRRPGEEERLVSTRAILDGRGEEPEILAGDVIFVPFIPQVRVHFQGALTEPPAEEIVLRQGTLLREALPPAAFAEEADRRRVELTRASGETRVLDLERIDHPDYALALEDGDLLFIPEQHVHRVLVIGAVRTPGPQNFTEGAPNLAEALAAAGGLTERARKELVILRSNKPGEQPEFIQVDWEQFLKRQDLAQNPPLAENDIIVVEEHDPRRRGNLVETVARFLPFIGFLFR